MNQFNQKHFSKDLKQIFTKISISKIKLEHKQAHSLA